MGRGGGRTGSRKPLRVVEPTSPYPAGPPQLRQNRVNPRAPARARPLWSPIEPPAVIARRWRPQGRTVPPPCRGPSGREVGWQRRRAPGFRLPGWSTRPPRSYRLCRASSCFSAAWRFEPPSGSASNGVAGAPLFEEAATSTRAEPPGPTAPRAWDSCPRCRDYLRVHQPDSQVVGHPPRPASRWTR